MGECPPAPSELLSPMVQEGTLSIALLSITALCLFTASYQGGSAGRLAILGYMEVPASYIVQVYAFGGELDPVAALGALVIVGASLVVASERARGLNDPRTNGTSTYPSDEVE